MSEMKVIARIRTDFPEKFGVPRQSGLIGSLRGRVVFEPEYRVAEAVRGLEEYSHIWLLWEFSTNLDRAWTPTIRPPRLGGNKRVGVFASRSPFRPNPVGLSVVRLEKITKDPTDGMVLHVSGIDMIDGTPVYDIKPYLPYVDSIPDASASFGGEHKEDRLQVVFSEKASADPRYMQALSQILAEDPRPHYQHDADRVYKMQYQEREVSFRVVGTTCIVEKIDRKE